MAGTITNGIEKIEIGGVTLGFTQEDTVSRIVTDNSTEVELHVEEQELPIYTRRVARKTSGFEFTIADPDEEAIKTLFGAVEDSLDPTTLNLTEGETHVIENEEFKLTPKMGWGFSSDDCTITAQFTESMGKNSFLGVQVTVMFDKGFSVFKV